MDCSYYDYPSELINEDYYSFSLIINNPRNSDPSKSVCDYYFPLSNNKKIKNSDGVIRENCTKIDGLLDQKYRLPVNKVYRVYPITNEDLCEILSELTEGYSNLFDITDSDILIDNHYRIRFLGQLCESCEIKIKEKGKERFRSKLKEVLLAHPTSILCKKCGEQIFQGENFCPKCGNQIDYFATSI